MNQLSNLELIKITGGATDPGSGVGGKITTPGDKISNRDPALAQVIGELVGSTPQGGGTIANGGSGNAWPFSIR